MLVVCFAKRVVSGLDRIEALLGGPTGCYESHEGATCSADAPTPTRQGRDQLAPVIGADRR
jgi:hypothetical protein